MARSFTLSYERLNTEDPVEALAVALLARAAFFAPEKPIPRDLLLSTLDLDGGEPDRALRYEDALRKLTDLGLLGTGEAGALRIHRLVADFVHNAANDEGAHAAVEAAVIDNVRLLIDEGIPAPLSAFLPHLQALTDEAQGREDEQEATLCTQLGVCLRIKGVYEKARRYLERALAIYEKVLGEEHRDTVMSLNNLARVLQAQGKDEQAQLLFKRALAIRERVLGKEHTDTGLP